MVILFLGRLLFQNGHNILLLPYHAGFYWLIYARDMRQDEKLINPQLFKPIRFTLGILCLLSISNSFLFTIFEFILNIKFVKVTNGWEGMNHPIANWLTNWQLIIFITAFINLILISKITIINNDD
jgi:hypothetical protein